MQHNSGAAGRAGEPGAGGGGSELPRLLPQFIIIGAMKSGTTTLYRYLDLHPAVEMSRDKETDFFLTEKNRARGLDWYAAQFTSEARVRGEASPNYTKRRDFPGVPERLARCCRTRGSSTSFATRSTARSRNIGTATSWAIWTAI
ncbi:MAG: sulfotransferase [Paracoccaceae bacterium]